MVRIIAGAARGRKLDTLEGMETRPTLDRVKEAVFGSLQFRIPYAAVLDLFAGSGNLGLEAASRGAKRVVFNDRNPACVAIIRKNLDTLRLPVETSVLNLDYAAAIERLQQQGETFDLVFCDPPYREGLTDDILQRLYSAKLIRPEGCVVLEHAAELAPQSCAGLYRVVKTKRFGKCGYSLIEEDGQ